MIFLLTYLLTCLLDSLVVCLFVVGCLRRAVSMRGAGCVVNDVWDARLDAMVERTKGRPLASGQISKKRAMALFFGVSAIGLAVLLQFNAFAIGLGLLSIPVFVLYPGTQSEPNPWTHFVQSSQSSSLLTPWIGGGGGGGLGDVCLTSA